MKNHFYKTACIAVTATILPNILYAQSMAGEIHSLQSVLDQLYDEMIPLCSQLIDVGRGLGGFAALWYIAARVWRHLASAEPIDFYPLLRPFALGLAILMFPTVLTIMNGVLNPIVTGTAAMVENSNRSIAFLLEKRAAEIKQSPAWQMYEGEGNYAQWYKYTNPIGDGSTNWLDDISNQLKFAFAKVKYNLQNLIRQWMSTVLQIGYEAAALCINMIRTFYLVVMSVLGPIVFGLAVFDGLQNSLVIWFARYINFFLWLPVANIFGAIIAKVQENMLRMDIASIEQYGDTFFTSADTAYLIFMVISIVGYFTVPSVANYIVTVAGENVHLGKSTAILNTVGGVAGSGAALPLSAAGALVYNTTRPSENANDTQNAYMHDKLSGK